MDREHSLDDDLQVMRRYILELELELHLVVLMTVIDNFSCLWGGGGGL